MAKVLANGQITITDLNDGRVISKYTNASQGYTQIYDSEKKLYNVDYSATPQVVTASVYASGKDTTDQAGTSACYAWKWYVNGTLVTTTTPNMTAASNKLTIKANLNSSVQAYNVRWECTFMDTTTKTEVLITDGCTINRTVSGTSAVMVNVSTEQGNIFDGKSATLPIKAWLTRGAQQDKTDLKFSWYKLTLDSKGQLTWAAVKTGVSTVDGTSTLTVKRDDVDGAQAFKVEITDTVLNDGPFVGFATMMDKLDEYTVDLLAPQGEVIKNGEGSVTITAVVKKNNEKVEDTSGMTFTWVKYNQNGDQVAWSDAGNPMTRTGNPITVTDKDVTVKTTIMVEVSM